MIEQFRKTILPDKLVGSDYEKIGIGGFTMYASVTEVATKTATVTANPVEDGSTLNDHIIKNPDTLTITGEVANVFIKNPIIPITVQEVVPAVGIVQNYLPSRTATQISKINALASNVEDYIEAADSAIDKGAQLFDYFTGKKANTTIGDKFLEFFDTVHESNSTIDVECIDKIYNNMVITSLSTTKLAKGNYTFTISLQKIVKAKTTVIQLTNTSGDAKSQAAGLNDKGNNQTKPVDQSFASALLSSFK